MLNVILFLSLLALFVVPAVFVQHKVYDDGVVGRWALCAVILFAAVALCVMLSGKLVDVDTRGMPWALGLALALLAVSNAVFLVWHLFRFHRRVLRSENEPHAVFHQKA